MKKIAIIALAAMLLLAGCAKQQTKPDSTVPGYFGQGQEVDGGSGTQKDANLSDIAVERRQEDVVLTLTFRQGSTAGNPAAPLCEKLPGYKVELLTAPSRVVVKLPISLCDFLGQELEPMGEFEGLVTQETDEGLALYFQFSGQVAYKAEEKGGRLQLSVRADDAKSVEQYHVKLIRHEENAAFAAQYGMTPALCDDGVSVCDLSAGMDSIEEADAVCQQLNDALEVAGSDDTAEVIQLNSGEAPQFTEPVSRSMLTMMGALKTESGVVDGQLVAMDARFLWWRDENSMLMARPQTEVTGEGNTESYEEIWVYSLDGKREQLIDTAFSSVQKAACSDDGRYIALLEQSDGARLIYLYDCKTDGLTFLSADGLGDYTADFDWGDNGVLYIMCGDDSMQLMAYDPAAAQAGGEAIYAVEEREGGYGNVGAANGKVYFNDEYGNVYAVDAQSGQRELFDIADGFVLAPDGSSMLLIRYEDGENASMATLVLCDLTSGEQVQIAGRAAVSDVVWSGDSRVLLYLVSNDGAADAEDYPVRLMRYNLEDSKTTDLGALASNSIFQGRSRDNVIVMFYQNRNGFFAPVTYELDLTSMTDHSGDELIVTVEGDENGN